MKEREEVFEAIFDAWKSKNISGIIGILSEDAEYKDHFGEEVYIGKAAIKERFQEFYDHHDLIEYKLIQIIHQKSKTIVNWTCTYLCHGDELNRDRMSIITFTEDCKIISIKEYVSASNQ